MNNGTKVSDEIVLEQVIVPSGGLHKFRLVACPGYKLIQYSGEDETYFDLILEDDDLATATVAYLERMAVPVVDWDISKR